MSNNLFAQTPHHGHHENNHQGPLAFSVLSD
jgi:hypothetical protein